MSGKPKKSPWGKVQYCEVLYPGVYDVSTAKKGGIMVHKNAVDILLSPAAQKCGFKAKGFLNFTEDAGSAVVERELLDKGLWTVPARFEDKADYEATINESLKKYSPEYWQKRESGLKPSLLAQAKENREVIKNQSVNTHTEQKDKAELLG